MCEVSLPKGLRYVTRQEWGAVEPQTVREARHPMEHVCFSYNIGTTPCEGDEECFKVLKQAQQDFMTNGLSDIPYNFLVGGDGTVYEGRGWHAQSSTSLGLTHLSRLDIAFIGEFEQHIYYMFDAALEFTYYGVDKKFVKQKFKISDIENGIKEQLQEKARKAEAEMKEKEKENVNQSAMARKRKTAYLLRKKFEQS